MKAPSLGTPLELVWFAVVVAVFFIFGPAWFWRVGGLTLAIAGLWTIRQRSVPVGIEGLPPSFYVKGSAAVVIGIIEVIGGVLIVTLAKHMPGAQ